MNSNLRRRDMLLNGGRSGHGRNSTSKLSGSSGNTSIALVSVALQDHIVRNMTSQYDWMNTTTSNNNRTQHSSSDIKIPPKKPKATSVIDTGLKSKQHTSSSSTSKSNQSTKFPYQEEEKDHVIQEHEDRSRVAKPSLAQKLGILPPGSVLQNPIPDKLNEQQWQSVKKQAGKRGDYSAACVICKETLGAQKHLITSCSHTFHKTCLEAFERFTGKKCCPMCRKEQYEKRIIHEASRAYKTQCATRIQATWKGFVVRKWYRKIRDSNPPRDPKLREKFFMQKFEEITQRMLKMYHTDVDSFLRELDVDLRNSRKIMASFNEKQALENHQLNIDQDFWDDVCGKAFSRIDDSSECPICMFQLVSNKTLSICSCTHVFHAQCLKTFEELSLNEQTLCPVCRSTYCSINR